MTSKNAAGIKLDVILENDSFYPGSIVKGTIMMKVFRKVKIFSVRTRLSGKEWSIIRKNKNGADVLVQSRQTFWKELMTLEGAPKTLQLAVMEANKAQRQVASGSKMTTNTGMQAFEALPGTYQYPFEFALPFGIPPSFQRKGEQEDYAAILYFVKAYVDIPGGRAADVMCRKFFTVVSRMSEAQWRRGTFEQPYAQIRKLEVSCACIDKGFVKTGVNMEKRYWSIENDKEIRFRVDVDNSEGQEPVEGVTVNLVHYLECSADSEVELRPETVGACVIEATVPKGSSGQYPGRIALPTTLCPSNRGIIIQSYYELIIEYDIPYALDPQQAIRVNLLQAIIPAETGEFMPKVELEQAAYHGMPGLNERMYVCPEDREEDLQRCTTAGSVESAKMKILAGLGSRSAKYDIPSGKISDSQRKKASRMRPADHWELPVGLEDYK